MCIVEINLSTILLIYYVCVHVTADDGQQSNIQWHKHPAIRNLEELIDLKHSCGYLTMVHIGVRDLGCEHRDPIVRLGRAHKSNPGMTRQIVFRTMLLTLMFNECSIEVSFFLLEGKLNNQTNLF